MDQASEVKSKVDIVDVISSYIPLKKAGRNLSGLCPFHGEKTPSFMVSPERQAFKCFGCGEAGDVFTFVEKIEGWEFRETLEELAKRAGVKLADYKRSPSGKIKEKLLEINKLTGKFYKYLLAKHKSGEPGRKYLKGRGIGEDIWEKYDLGFAPDGWENLEKFLAKRGYGLEDVANAGLVIGRTGRGSSYYDRFRNRIIFPIKDSKGSILGFSGRVIEGTNREAKYINSPETPIFNKGSLLFGLDVAKSAIREKSSLVLVEGEFDVLSSFAAGVENVVASKGTALTEKQVSTISRLCEKVILCFDTDLAGDAAARRGIELLDSFGVGVKVAGFGKFKDPDEFAKADPAGFKKALDASVNVYDYFIDSAKRRFDSADPEGKKAMGKEILPVLSKISDDMVRAHYVAKFAAIVDLPLDLVSDAVSKRTSVINVGTAEIDSSNFSIVKISQEEYFLALFMAQDEIFGEILELLLPSDFQNERATKLWKLIHDIIGRSKTKKISGILSKLPKDLNSFVDNLFLLNIKGEFADKELWSAEIVKTAKMLKDKSLRRQQVVISVKLKEAQISGDDKKMLLLSDQFKKLNNKRRSLES